MKCTRSCFLRATVAIAVIVASQVGVANAAVVVVSTTIQEAENSAKPGDTIVVPPGIYRETVRVNKDDITILGSEDAVIDAGGFANGIHVGADLFGIGPDSVPVCPALAVKKFTLIGLTVRNATQNGVFLGAVDNYTIIRGRYIDNGDYGIFPNCSNNGEIAFNYVKGGVDTCIYAGDDVDVSITGNQAIGCTIGIQIVNSSEVFIRANVVTGNTAGIIAVVDPANPFTSTDNVLIERNAVIRNNLPNHATEAGLQMIPSGTGILDVGGDNLRIVKNKVVGNNTFGVAITRDPIEFVHEDPRIDPIPDGNEVRQNVILDNGRQPAPGVPGADLFYDGTGKGNCFSKNTFKTAIPPNIEAQFPCQSRDE